jgi:hypothetical protein
VLFFFPQPLLEIWLENFTKISFLSILSLGWRFWVCCLTNSWSSCNLTSIWVNGNVSRCSFTIVTSDGSFQHIEISQEPSASISSALTSDNGLTLKRQFNNNVFCFDYHPELSLLVVVGGSDSISLASGGNSGMCLCTIFSIQFSYSEDCVFFHSSSNSYCFLSIRLEPLHMHKKKKYECSKIFRLSTFTSSAW